MLRSVSSRAVVWGALLALAGCAGDAARYDRALVARELEARSGFEISTARNDATVKVPDGVFLADGIDEDEAVVLSLWNDPDYQEALATLGFARADVIAAGLLANPALSVLFPAGSKQLEFTIGLPLELFFLRPKRLEAAKLDAERAVLVLVDAGLALIERVRLAWADGRLAHARAVDAEDLLEIAAEIAEHQAERLRAGDVSESEASLARVTALEEAQASERLRLEVEVAELRLRRFLGLDTPDGREVGLDFDEDFPPQGSEGAAADPSGKSMPEIDADELVRTAWSSRPDLRAAELALSSASERAGLSRWESLAVQAVLDANGDGGDSQFEIGPGLDAKVPIFDWNQAGMARADAEVERAALALAALRRKVALDVREAVLRADLAAAEVAAFEDEILPSLRGALEQARRAFEIGATSRLVTLETRRRLVLARTAAAESKRALLAARANLERAVGAKVGVGRALGVQSR